MMRIGSLSLLLVLALAGSALARGDDTTDKSTTIPFVPKAPKLDGILDDPVWAQAVVIDDLHQVRPTEYAAPSQRTEFLLAYDEHFLYFGARMFEADPDLVIANVLRQGESLSGDDRIGIILDPIGNRRSGYWFLTNPNGLRRDGIFKGDNADFNWDSIWEVESAMTEFGWSSEMAIPFKSLNLEEDAIWGLNFVREIEHSNEQISWSSRNRNYFPSVAGTATGIRGVSQGRGLDIVPSISVQATNDRITDEEKTRLEPSLNFYYKITPALNGSLTLNTDFSATEVDNRQVDLSRFSLFFPEKRSFFLREADIFEFGGIGIDYENGALSRSDRENARPFFSRRIGLSRTGEPVGLDVGARLAGRVGQWNVGALGIRQEAFGDIDATDIFVGRLSTNVLSESTVGLIATHGDPRSNLDNDLLGIDFLYRNSRLPGGKLLEANLWYQQSDTEGLHGDDSAFSLTVAYPSQTGWRAGASVLEVEQNFNPALGFVSRSGVRQFTADTGYTHRFRDGKINSASAGVDFQRVNFIDGGLQTQLLLFQILRIENQKNDRVEIEHIVQKENLLKNFEISDGILIPPGEYRFAATAVSVRSSDSRPANFEIAMQAGDFYTGKIKSLDLDASWRPSPYLSASVSYGIDFVDLPEGKFDRRVIGANLTTVFSNKLSWANLIQFDNVSSDLGIDSRLHWVPRAGRNVYLVVSHNMRRDDADNNFDPTTTGVTLKLDHTFRF